MVTIWTPDLSPFSGPKYLMLADAIAAAIARGELEAGARLPPQRQLADKLGVTVGTVTRAYDEGRRRGQLEARVGSGTYVRGNERPMPVVPMGGPLAMDGAMAPLGPQGQMMSEALQALAADANCLYQCLPYPQENGLAHQRLRFIDWLAVQGLVVTDQQLLLTCGGQHGLSLALEALCQSGDTVLTEGMSFPGIRMACERQGLKAVGLAMDEQGLLPDALEAACRQYRPRVLYLTANLQNPSCATLPLARRLRILALCRQFDVRIIEDDVQFVDPAIKPPAFFTLAPDITVFVSSFSKRYSGAMRVGFMLFDSALYQRLLFCLRASVWTVSPLQLELVSRWLADGQMQRLEAWLGEEMRARRRLADSILGEGLLQGDPSSFNCWLVLPEPWRAADFARATLEQGVKVRTGEDYAVGRFAVPQGVRLSISQPAGHAQLAEALGVLKKLLDQGPGLTQAIV
ncbi:PLP-dependent aminotransferase family protein [Gallaecimonas pentaromativorans]|uniref:GntR family transcriptional regulator n=1 Tax=Gallaecimonas pentaromativorans TaxID=584787 RepID=A0A3N1P202_9GAMM|nr:PLP-dependent aminotransferase family protein [Gallaecimonas pentaromativorans]ROQ22485.1 GntR family transcriptional regulator [Gallaecimonas pentaromativorans]